MTGPDDIPIHFVAKLCGMNPNTIRMWEIRYGWPTPRRLANGFRIYTRGEVEDIKRAYTLVKKGFNIRKLICDGFPSWPTPKPRPNFRILNDTRMSVRSVPWYLILCAGIQIRDESRIVSMLHRAPIDVIQADRENAAWLPTLIGCAIWSHAGQPLKREPEMHDAIHRSVTPTEWEKIWLRTLIITKGSNAPRT